MTQDFYDQLAPYYHLLYPNWEASSARQSRGLADVLGEFGVPAGSAVLDAACGSGTQALGLAQLGYHFTAWDFSPAAVARARVEAGTRGLAMTFAVADLRQLSSVIGGKFRAVIACDNAIPHLLSDAEIAASLAECRRLLDPGGVLLVSVRDYASIERRTPGAGRAISTTSRSELQSNAPPNRPPCTNSTTDATLLEYRCSSASFEKWDSA
jgi:SAM-dependent methyltransferase